MGGLNQYLTLCIGGVYGWSEPIQHYVLEGCVGGLNQYLMLCIGGVCGWSEPILNVMYWRGVWVV